MRMLITDFLAESDFEREVLASQESKSERINLQLVNRDQYGKKSLSPIL
jgi:hypothetical protein